MKIRVEAPLLKIFPGPYRPVKEDAEELVFMKAVCAGDAQTYEPIFAEGRLFSEAPVVIDTPWKRYEGFEAVKQFAADWNPRFNAVESSIRCIFQTRAGGRSVSECVADFVVDGEINQVPMFVVADLRTKGTLEEIRIYCHATYVPGLTPYRKPIWIPGHLEMGDPQLLTGAVKEYYSALHHTPYVDADRILKCMNVDCKFGGYEPPERSSQRVQTMEGLREEYTHMSTYIPSKVAMRYETIIDDGRTGVLEWVHVISDMGRRDLGRVAMSGIAAYERGDNGKLCAIRISDYAGYESKIDWTQTEISRDEAYAINSVRTFPTGVGTKGQD